MRWSIIRLIWMRELRDQLRDRRTLFMIAILPVFLYPVAGYGLMQMARGFLTKPSVIEVYGFDNLPQPAPFPAASLLALTPPPPGVPLAGLERATGAVALSEPAGGVAPFYYPPLFVKDGDTILIPADYFDKSENQKTLQVNTSSAPLPDGDPGSLEFRKQIDSLLTKRQADLILVVPPHFAEDLQAAKQPKLYVFVRSGEERSKLVGNRFGGVLQRWQSQLVDVRLARRGLNTNYNKPFDVPEPPEETSDRSAELYSVLVKVFPFILVMWSLAGALYPAVDLCAGEKERGTMETLLISPASREEIVWGKFLTIWVFSAVTALLNLLSMGITTMQLGSVVHFDTFRMLSLLWGVLLLLPLSAFFSAVCLAIGAYARSSKEGQYYLMPLFLVTMPLIFLTLVPDIKLNPFYSMVPITGVALLLQELMLVKPEGIGNLMVYFIPVLGPMLIYSWLALRWAIEQFQREEVLFREAERLDLGLWLRSLFREKEPLPTTGQALFCFGLVLVLSRLSISFGERLPLMVQMGIRYLAFVGTPALFMALFVTSQPLRVLGLRLPAWWALPAGAVLAVLLFVPGLEYAHLIRQIPAVRASLLEFVASQSSGLPAPGDKIDLLLRWQVGLMVLLGSVCEELAFRGFILSGLQRRFKPWTAVFISSFLFALSQMNVFQFVPHFVVGVALGLLVIRTRSVLPAMVCHVVFNALSFGPLVFPEAFEYLGYANEGIAAGSTMFVALAATCLVAAVGLLYAIWLRTNSAPLSPAIQGEKMVIRNTSIYSLPEADHRVRGDNPQS